MPATKNSKPLLMACQMLKAGKIPNTLGCEEMTKKTEMIKETTDNFKGTFQHLKAKESQLANSKTIYQKHRNKQLQAVSDCREWSSIREQDQMVVN